jgi:hypothetical protein
MVRWLLPCLVVLAFVCMVAPVSGKPPVKETKPSPQAAPVKGADEPPPKRMTVDQLKLPPGGVLVLVEQAKDALDLLPRIIYLKPEVYQEILDRISTLERQLKVEKKLPNVCKLTGRLEGDLMRLQADFKFATDRPRTLVFLGGQGAVITDAKLDADPGNLDGQLPVLDTGDGGYSVHIEQPGEHALTLKLQLPVVVRPSASTGGGPERGFELGLPGAAVTLLTLELPAAVKELHWNEMVEKQRSPGGAGSWTIPLGRVKNLTMSWKEPVAAPGVGPLRAADGQILVHVDEGHVVTTADLMLQDLRGQAREWRVWVPPQAKLDVKAPPGVACDVVNPPNPTAPYTLRLGEPTAERIHVVAQARYPRPLSRLPVGPFSVLDAYRQQGIITIKAAPEAMRGLKLVYHRQSEVVERDASREAAGADVVAVFKYWNMPPGGSGKNAVTSGAPLEVEWKPIKGAVETQVEHLLQLKKVQEGLQVLAVTRIHATPVHDGVDFLEVQLPRGRLPSLDALSAAPTGFPINLPWAALFLAAQPDWPVRVPQDYELEGEEGAAGAEMQIQLAGRKAAIKLPRFQARSFTVALTGSYTLPPGVSSARLELPRPLSVLDRGAKVKVEAEGNLELLAGEGAGEVALPHTHQQTIVWQRAPATVDLAWRPYRPELPVQITADVTLHERHGHIRHLWQFPVAETTGPAVAKGIALTPASLLVHVPEMVHGLKVVAGGKLQSQDLAAGTAWVVASTGAPGPAPIILEYDFPLPSLAAQEAGQKAAGARPFAVPLLWPESATRAETRVRFWCPPGTIPALAGQDLTAGSWHEQSTEIVPGHDSLPALVVAASGLKHPLKVRLAESGLPALPGAVVDRALIQVAVDEEGTETYRARFVVTRLSAAHLDVELPAAPAGLMLQVSLDHKRVPWRLLEGGGKVVRLSVNPQLVGQPAVLDFSYRLVRGHPSGEGFWRTSLLAPVPVGDVLLGRVRWQVTVPPGLIALVVAGDTYVEQQWTWQGWLPTPEPTTTAADLERWLGARETGDVAVTPSLVCWRAGLRPLRVLRVPQQLWFLACSGLFLAVGLGLSFIPWTRFAFWLFVVVLGGAVLAAVVLWPAVVPMIAYGCQPGALVLAVILGLQWLLHRQYRRQVVFMPGFTRLKPGSSLVRAGGAGRARETSTIDAPAAQAASQGSGISKVD